MATSILVVDDEQSLCKLLQDALTQSGYTVAAAHNVQSAKGQLEIGSYDLIVLDIMMPGENGMTLLRWLRREQNSRIPVILLTGISTEEDKLEAFELGADDYVVKPFSLAEFEARIKAVLRRAKGGLPTEIEFGDCKIDRAGRQVYRDGKEIKLRLKEYQILTTLAESPGVAISRQDLFRSIWGDDSPSGEKTVDVTIHTLRDKVEPDPANPVYILTVRGYGYRFSLTGTEDKAEA